MFRILQILTALVATFIGLSLFLTVAWRFVPVPVTATMLMDENGYTKDWQGLGDIDRSLVRAVIAAEDQNFCEHSGFDYAAMQAAMENNLQGGK
ncbi:MAG: transglycosylase domain-containing protein, partial [Alteriqipengyuania sp.]